MVNLVRLNGGLVELPYHRLQYPLTPLQPKLQAALEAHDSLRLDVENQTLPQERRAEAVRFLRRVGDALREWAFPAERHLPLNPRLPLLLELSAEWAGLPWELLHDGEEWWALRQGVVRHLTPPDHKGGIAPPEPEPLRVAAITAQPIPVSGESALAHHEAELGTRFITSASELAAPEGGEPTLLFHCHEHATREELEAVLRDTPHVLLFSGFSCAEGFYLESDRLTPQKVGVEWLSALTRQAAQAGLRLLVLNDSLALLDGRGAATHGRLLLESGVPALVRFEGRLTRPREQDYARCLLRTLAEGASPFMAHRAAVRRLARRWEESWDWSFIRLYLRSQPAASEVYHGDAEVHPRQGARGERSAAAVVRNVECVTPMAPPLFLGRRRTFNRYAETLKLAEMLNADTKSGATLIFLNGPAGSGKTMLALHLARRLRRRFAQTAWVTARELLPDPFELASPGALTRVAGGSLEQLFAALARHLGLRAMQRGASERWDRALAAYLGDGKPRLIVLDRLETVPGFEGFCAALPTLPAGTRFLLLGRRRPPQVAGRVLDLPPLDAGGMARVYGEAFLERLAALPWSGLLRAVCAQDLLAGRILRRLPSLPRREALEQALAAAHAGPGAPMPTGPLLRLLLDQALGLLSPDARTVLAAQCLFSHLVHREVLADATGLEGRRLQAGLTELQWLGLLDAYDGERYFALPARTQNHLAERVLTDKIYQTFRDRLALSVPQWLAGCGAAAEVAQCGVPLLAWGGERGEEDPCASRPDLRRLGVERVVAADLAAMLADAEDWDGLARLSDSAQGVQGVPEWADCLHLVNHCLLAGGEAARDPARQAAALCRLGQGQVLAGQFAAAEPLLARALELVGATNAWDVMAEVYHWLARCHSHARRYEAAANLHLAALELAQQTGQVEHMVRALEALGALWQAREKGVEQAAQVLPPRIAHLESLGRHDAAARVRRLLGDLYLHAGRRGEARVLHQQAETHFRGARSAREAFLTALRLAEGYALEGQAKRALETLQAARQEWSGPGDPAAECRVLMAAAQSLQEQGEIAAALDGYLEARRLMEAAGDRDGVIRVLDVIGGLYFRLGDQAQSTLCYQERLQLQAVPSPS
jgi:tetratricopeptide (TPR) repeat protein